MNQKRRESLLSITVCPKSQYILVEIRNLYLKFYSSRMMILKVTNDRLIKMASFDHLSQYIGDQHALEPIGYQGAHILWMGVSSKQIQLYGFNTETWEFREFEDKRLDPKEFDPLNFAVVGDNFYFTGQNGKLNCLIVNFK